MSSIPSKPRHDHAWCLPNGQRGWPERRLPFNLVQRLTGGLGEVYATVKASVSRSAPARRAHKTSDTGRLVLRHDIPLLGGRYHYLHALSQSDLSQIVCAVDTYRHCAPTPEGRRRPLVAIKVMNAQHWTLGAQEHERVRLLWRGLSDADAGARLLKPRGHFEEEAHFCLVFDMLAPLATIATAAAAAAASSTAPPPRAVSGVPFAPLARAPAVGPSAAEWSHEALTGLGAVIRVALGGL